MQFLAAQLQAAESEGNSARIEQLQPIYAAIMAEAENQMPPEVRLINALVATDDEAQMQQVINQIPLEARPGPSGCNWNTQNGQQTTKK